MNVPKMPRKRAVKVCRSCHNHKIRCDVDATGIPCSKCVEIGEECKIRARKQYPNRRRLHRPNQERLDIYEDNVAATTPKLSSVDSLKIVAAAIPEPSSRIAPIFVGEGGYGTIIDAAGETSDRHFYVPTKAEKALAAEDLEYLKVKGCFDLPVESKELLEAYFRLVHPMFPVIDASSFLQEYAVTGLKGVNLLLLWSMFSVSASYVPLLSRKASKELYVYRAKLLFDLSQEMDKTVLVQSALLLSFWFADTEDVMQSWYWTSIAISIAQTLGLHREFQAPRTRNTSLQRSLWRSIWQCCMVRDIWLAFGMGRPLRTKASDSDYSASEELDRQFIDLTLHGDKLYGAKEAAGFVSIWQSLLHTSRVLRSIITDRPSSPLQAGLAKYQIEVQNTTESTSLLAHVERHLKLHQYAATIALARANDRQEEIEKAANSLTAVVQTLLQSAVMRVAPITIPLVVPAMVTYLTMTRSEESETRRLGTDTLKVYSDFFTAIEDNFPAATIVKRVIAATQDEICSRASLSDDFGEMQQVF